MNPNKNNKDHTFEFSYETSEAVLYHMAPKFLKLADILAWRLAVSNRYVTALCGRQQYALTILLSRYFNNRTISIRKELPRLSSESIDRISRSLSTLSHVEIIGNKQSMEFDVFTEILSLFVRVKKMSLQWHDTNEEEWPTRSKAFTPQTIYFHMRNLTWLTLFKAEIKNIDAEILGTAKKLNVLKLKHCSFVGNSEENLSQLTSLFNLKICQPIFIGYSRSSKHYLTSLTQLKVLSLSQFENRDITGIRSLGALLHLEKLRLDQADALTDDNIDSLLALSKLYKLSLIGCYNITLGGIEILSSLKKLKSLAIRYIDTWFSNKEKTSLIPLTKFTGLEHLELEGCENEVVGNIPESSPGITNLALVDIGRMTWLTMLSIDASPADFNCLKYLLTLTKLEYIRLYVLNNIEEMQEGFMKKLLPSSVKTLELLSIDYKQILELFNHQPPNLTCLNLSGTFDIEDWRMSEDGPKMQEIIEKMQSKLTIKLPY